MDRVLAAAEAALSVALTGAEELSRGRSLVLGARAGDRLVVVKAPLETGPGQARERAALRVLQPRDSRIPVRRAFLHHRLTTAPGEGPLADLAAATAAALSRAYGGHPLILAPAVR